MTVLDDQIASAWAREQRKAKFRRRRYDEVMDDVLAATEAKMMPQDFDELVFRSAAWSRLGIGTGFAIQRRILLRLLDQA